MSKADSSLKGQLTPIAQGRVLIGRMRTMVCLAATIGETRPSQVMRGTHQNFLTAVLDGWRISDLLDQVIELVLADPRLEVIKTGVHCRVPDLLSLLLASVIGFLLNSQNLGLGFNLMRSRQGRKPAHVPNLHLVERWHELRGDDSREGQNRVHRLIGREPSLEL